MPYPYALTHVSADPSIPPQFPLAALGPYEYLSGESSILYVVYAETSWTGPPFGTLRRSTVWASPALEPLGSAGAGVTWGVVAAYPAKSTAYDVQVVRAGNILYVTNLDSSGAVQIIPFTMGANTWGTAITGGPSPAANSNAPVSSQAPKWSFVRRSDGSYVVLYQINETVSGSDYGRIYYKIYSGGSWGSAVAVDSENAGLAKHSGLIGCALGDEDLTHFLWVDGDSLAIAHKSLSASGSLSSLQAMPSGQRTATDPPLSVPIRYTDACGDDYVALADAVDMLAAFGATSPTVLAYAHVAMRSTANPAMRLDAYGSRDDGPSDGEATGDDPAMALVWDNGTLYLFWATKGEASGATYKIMHAANQGAGWGAPAELFDAGSGVTNRITRVYAQKIAAGVGVILASEDGSSSYGVNPYYWQGELTATAPEVCSGGVDPEPAEGCLYAAY